MMEPARTVIEIFGGYKSVAEAVGRSISRVRRWTYSRECGGTGGLVPADMQQMLLRVAVQRNIPLTPEHFFPWFPSARASAGHACSAETSPQPAASAASNNEPNHDTSPDDAA